MPPRKKAKTDRIQELSTTSTHRTTRASNKAVNTVTADTSNDQLQVAPAVSSVIKLRRGCLREIPNFAVEIQLMIFGNLHPLDLFNLSRTSKMFHDFFLHRSNEPLWEAALENAEDLPARPPWMSIPAFIHLLFSTHCHHCARPNTRKVIWRWFARYCSKCLPDVTCTVKELVPRLSAARFDFSLGYALYGFEAPTSSKRAGYRKTYWYLKRDIDELINKWSALPEPRDAEVIKAFRTQCSDRLENQRKYAVRCMQWQAQQEEDHQDDLRNGRTVRFAAIVDKLKETGWEKDLDFLGPDGLEKMSAMPVVRQSAKLTNKGWENVQEALHTFLHDTREARLKKERGDLIRQRFAALDEAIIAHCITTPRNAIMDCRPVALDFAFKATLEPIANAASSESLTRETFAAIVPNLVTNWHTEQRQFLQSLLRRFITRVPKGVDILDLAIAVVYTKTHSDARMMRYPYLLASSSFRDIRGSRGGDEFTSSHYAAPAAAESWMGPYDLKSVDPRRVEVGVKWMRNIVANLGLNPDTATFSDLEQCKARVLCLKCAEFRQDYAYTWEAAFNHTAGYDHSHSKDISKSSHSRWAGVHESDMAKVKELEAVAHVLRVDSTRWWSCALCVSWKSQGAGGAVRQHLSSEHGIEDAESAIDDGTIYWSPLHNDTRRRCVKL